jgi:large subunit ribosomal protein L4
VSTAIEVPAYQADGTPRPRAVRLPADPFDGRVHEPVMHQAVKVYLANQRQGTAQTKTRGLVSGGNRKPWRQKGTGRARQGSIRAPNWPGGGTVFGPQPRDYRQGLPRKVRSLARRSALNARAREQALRVIAPLLFEEPKTRKLVQLLGKMGLEDYRVLVLTGEHKPVVARSARNMPNVEVMRYQDASTYDILRADAVVVEEPALGGQLETGAEVTHAPVPKRQAPPPVEVAEAAEAGTAAPARPAARKQAATKRAGAPAPAQGRAAKAAKQPSAKARAAKPKAAAKRPAKQPGKKKD